MKVSIDISLYPLKNQYREPIKAFIETLTGRSDIEITYNSMSTTLFADYQTLMPMLEATIKNHLQEIPESVFVIKLSGGCHFED